MAFLKLPASLLTKLRFSSRIFFAMASSFDSTCFCRSYITKCKGLESRTCRMALLSSAILAWRSSPCFWIFSRLALCLSSRSYCNFSFNSCYALLLSVSASRYLSRAFYRRSSSLFYRKILSSFNYLSSFLYWSMLTSSATVFAAIETEFLLRLNVSNSF